MNVDLFPKQTAHRPSGRKIDLKKVPNFVKADALHLPFKNNAFNTVYNRHVIEHVESPVNLLQEVIRVSNKKVIITCPHRFAHKPKITKRGIQLRKASGHKWGITRKWIEKTLNKLNVNWKIKTTYSPLLCIGPVGIFNCPNEIKIEIIKLKN